MKDLFKLVLISTLTLGVFGCSANSVEEDAADAKVTAADARASAADANARLTAADAHVRAADAPSMRQMPTLELLERNRRTPPTGALKAEP